MNISRRAVLLSAAACMAVVAVDSNGSAAEGGCFALGRLRLRYRIGGRDFGVHPGPIELARRKPSGSSEGHDLEILCRTDAQGYFALPLHQFERLALADRIMFGENTLRIDGLPLEIGRARRVATDILDAGELEVVIREGGRLSWIRSVDDTVLTIEDVDPAGRIVRREARPGTEPSSAIAYFAA
jgi:hypothetical protein